MMNNLGHSPLKTTFKNCKTLRRQIKAQEEDKQSWESLKENFEEKLKEQGYLMVELQTLYINIEGELDSWKTTTLEWKENINHNTQEQDHLQK